MHKREWQAPLVALLSTVLLLSEGARTYRTLTDVPDYAQERSIR